MLILRILGGVVLLLVVLALGYIVYATNVINPRVERELIENPQGERAGRVMLLTLPSGRRIPVNYYQDTPHHTTRRFTSRGPGLGL